jgi:CIC family chloride channel protein
MSNRGRRARSIPASWWARLPALSRLHALRRRSQQVLVLAGATGVVVGLAVAVFDWVTADVLLDRVLELSPAAAAGAPLVGLVLAAALLRWLAGRASPATADEYIRNFHDPTRRLDNRPVLGRLAAAITTLGFGGTLGYEGPALYAGAAIGTSMQRRLARYFSAEETKVLLVAGAAAGVAAIFKAPVTGLVFALEVPYQEDLARRTLLPAAMAAATSYVTYVSFVGTAPLLPIAGQPPFDLVDLAGAAAVGLAAGLFARVFIVVISAAKRVATGGHPWLRAIGAGISLAALFLLGRAVAETNLTLGPGYDTLRWALDPSRSVPLISAVAVMRVAATASTVAGGGVGGLFIPLVIQGALIGRVAGGLFDASNPTLFPVVGIAAFLGAGYRVPLAAVVFVAEFTGRPGFIVPGLIAAVVAQLVMGRASLSPYQVAGRVGHLEQRLRLPLAAVVDTTTRTVPSDATVEEVFWQHLIGSRRRTAAVVDGNTYRGMVSADALAELPRDEWRTTPVADIMRTDVPVAAPQWLLGEAIRAMDEASSDQLAVCDADSFVGVISSADLVVLDEILDSGATTPPTDSRADEAGGTTTSE